MGRSPCCEKVGLKKGPWTPEEDHKLLAYIDQHGHGSWRALPSKAGLERCGKSCRLRWTNYLRSDIKRGKFSSQEDQTIIQLHALLGNRWSAIATHLPKRTDNEIKNYWNTHLKKGLTKMGIDPLTHKSRNNTIISTDGQSKHAANLSHMAQWESARLEAETRLVRQSELRSTSNFPKIYTFGSSEFSSSSSTSPLSKPKEWFFKSFNGVWDRGGAPLSGASVAGIGADLESSTSSLSYSDKIGENSTAIIEFVRNSSIMEEGKDICKEIESSNNFSGLSYTSGLRELTMPVDSSWAPPEQIQPNSDHHDSNGNYVQRFTDLLHSNNNPIPRDHETVFSVMDSDKGDGNGTEYFEDKKNYWNSILNVVNSSPADSPIFEWELTS